MTETEQVRPRVLCADDHREFCDSLKETLEDELQVRVDACYDGDAAIDWLIEASRGGKKAAYESYRFVILDMYMPKAAGPGIDPLLGIKVLRRYQLLDPGTPIIIYTAYPSYRNCVDSIKAGAYHYLPKVDPHTGIANTDHLLSLCKDILFPPLEETETWIKDHLGELQRRYAGQYVAIIDDPDVASEAGVASQRLADKTLIAGNSMEAVQRIMLLNKRLRWLEPKILTVPPITQ